MANTRWETPLDYMLAVMRDEASAPDVRLQAAIAAAPYCHHRLISIEHFGLNVVAAESTKAALDDDEDLKGLH